MSIPRPCLRGATGTCAASAGWGRFRAAITVSGAMLVLFGCTTVRIESALDPVAVRVERHCEACTCRAPCRHMWPRSPRNRRASNTSTSFFLASTASRQRRAPCQAVVPGLQAGLATGAGPPWPGRCVPGLLDRHRDAGWRLRRVGRIYLGHVPLRGVLLLAAGDWLDRRRGGRACRKAARHLVRRGRSSFRARFELFRCRVPSRVESVFFAVKALARRLQRRKE